MIKQSECHGADEDIQRRMVSNWKTSEVNKIHKYWLKILTDPYLSSKYIYWKCCKSLEGWSMLMEKEKKRERGGTILKTCDLLMISEILIETISENQYILMMGST